MGYDLVCTDDFGMIRALPNDVPSPAFFSSMMEEKRNGAVVVPPGDPAIFAKSGGGLGVYFVPADLRAGRIITKRKGVKK